MKKNLLSLAVAASAAGITSMASAQMYLNPEKTGEALVFPFYSAQGGNDTYIHVVNTTGQTKAVKVRILEGVESLETLDFNLYMSPEDHFSFAITADGDGAKLVTGDSSCTAPAIVDNAQAFTDLKWTTGGEAREQVGYVEIIEMGQIVEGSDTAKAVLHSQSTGLPADCSVVVENWSVDEGDPGAWYEEAGSEYVGSDTPLNAGTGSTDFAASWNGGGLYGVATVINVAEGTAFGYDAVAIEDLVDPSSTGWALHYDPGDTRPDFSDSSIDNTATVMVNGASATYATSPLSTQNAVSALFMSESITNDYVIDPAMNSLTDWVVTMPTKILFRDADGDYAAPFSNTSTSPLSGKTSDLDGCQPVSMTGYDREEGVQDPPEEPVPGSDEPQFSPSVRPDPEAPVAQADAILCAESSIIHFGASSATNSESNLASMGAFVDGWDAGWAVLELTEDGLNNTLDNDRELPGTVSGSDGNLQGLPVTGFAVVEYTNTAAGSAGALANYQMSWEHKTSTVVASSGD